MKDNFLDKHDKTELPLLSLNVEVFVKDKIVKFELECYILDALPPLRQMGVVSSSQNNAIGNNIKI